MDDFENEVRAVYRDVTSCIANQGEEPNESDARRMLHRALQFVRNTDPFGMNMSNQTWTELINVIDLLKCFVPASMAG